MSDKERSSEAKDTLEVFHMLESFWFEPENLEVLSNLRSVGKTALTNLATRLVRALEEIGFAKWGIK